MRGLVDKVAVVAGGGSGIGAAAAVRLAEEGAQVVVGDLVAANAEGRVIGPGAPAVPGVPGVPFTGEAIRRLAGGSESMQAAGAAVLQLAWQHRGSLLG